MDPMMQSAVIELIQKDAALNLVNKVSLPPSIVRKLTPQAKYLRLIFDLLESSSNTVVYEAATSLANLTSNPAAIKGSFPSNAWN